MNEKKALDNHMKGYNCAQSVACLYADELGVDEKEIFRMMEAYGLGMGTMGTCGVISAMAAVAGMKNSDGNLTHPKTKGSSYKLIKTMTEEFQKKNGSVICRELKGVETGTPLRSCSGCIEDAVDIIEKTLFNR